MPLWNSAKRYRKPRPASRVSALFSIPTATDIGDDHAFSTSSNGYGPQVIPDAGFRPNSLVTWLPEKQAEEESSSKQPDSPVSVSSSVDRKGLEPWSAAAVGRTGKTGTTLEQANDQQRFVPDANRGGLWSWIPHIGQSADDDTVLYRVKEVFLFAEQFVINYYVDRASTTGQSLEALSRVNRSESLSTDQLQTYLTEGTYQTTLIKHILVSLMLSLISFHSIPSQGSLLPREFQNYIALATARVRSNADEILHLQPALSAYRVLAAYIHSNFDRDEQYSNDIQRISKEIAHDFREAFKPWLEIDKSQDDWESSFRVLVNKSAGLGAFLFSQPSVYFFGWEMSPGEQTARLIPLRPRLLRVFDDEAQLRDVSDHLLSMKCGMIFESTAPQS